MRIFVVLFSLLFFCSCGFEVQIKERKPRKPHPTQPEQPKPPKPPIPPKPPVPPDEPQPQPQPQPEPDPQQPPLPPFPPVPPFPLSTDNIYGVEVPRSESWYVDSGNVYHNNQLVGLKGLNWFGFETSTLVVHGLWTGRSVESFISQIKGLGFNALRIPIAPQVFEGGYESTQGKKIPLENLKDVVRVANQYGVNVLIDIHTCNYRAGLVGSPTACGGYTLESWYATLEKIANLAKEYPNILGVDLYNEPYGHSWADWKNMVSIAGSRVLKTNPKILIFVEGVANLNTDNAGYNAFWGGNLVEAARNLPDIPKSRLVLSPHVYGPSVAWQGYFNDSNFPLNMEKIWDLHFGYLVNNGFTVIMGEFGGRYADKDKLWQDAFIAYLNKKNMKNFFYWSLNPNSGDTGGILLDDWWTVNQDKLNLLRPLF